MPSSHWRQLNEIVETMILASPRSVLDIGVGFGKFGVLAREYLDLWDGRQVYDDWQRRVDGIEVFESYITPLHEFVYDNIYVGDAREVLPTLDHTYDLILLVDVLEHFTYEDGLKVLAECRKRSNNLLIVTPKDVSAQTGDAFGNAYEEHKFQWSRSHVEQEGDHVLSLPSPQSQILLIGEAVPRVRQGFSASGRMQAWARRKAGRVKRRLVSPT